MKQCFLVLGTLGACSCLATVSAALSSILADDSGFYNAEGRSSKNDGLVLGAVDATYNYSAGAIDEVAPLAGLDVPRKNYFVFDLTGVTDDITSAAVELYNPAGGYSSPDATEDYLLSGVPAASLGDMASFVSDISMTYSILVPAELDAAKTLYGELASIPDFGMKTVSAADDDSLILIPLDAGGIGYLNMFKGGKVVIAGFIGTLDGAPGADEVVFGFTKPLPPGASDPGIVAPTPTPVLHIETVPEPSAALLFLSGSMLCLIRRRSPA